MTAVTVRRVDAQLGPDSGAWPSSDEDWVDWPEAQVLEDAEGHANDVGMASIVVPYGMSSLPDSTTDAVDSPPAVTGTGDTSDPYKFAIPGRYLRLRYYDTNGENPTAYWWGFVSGLSYVPRGEAEFELRVQCTGLLGVLDKAVILQGPEQGIDAAGGAGVVWTEAGAHPNGNEGGAGDRSAAELAVGVETAYAVDRLLAGAVRQRAQDVAKAILIGIENQQGQLGWDIDGQIAALVYSDEWKLYGMTAREALTAIINPRYGCTFTATVVNHTPTLRVTSILPVAVVSGDVDLPASNRTSTPDATPDSLLLKAESFQVETAAEADIIIMEAPPTLHVLTVTTDEDADPLMLVKGWDDSIESDWDDASESERDLGPLAMVWRRFSLHESWRGGDHGDPTKVWPVNRAVSATTTDALHGYNGATGAFSASAASPLYIPNGRRHRLARQLPLYEGVDWETATTFDRNQPRMRPMAFVVEDGEWYTLADYIGQEMTVCVDDIDGSIVFGNGPSDALAIKDILDAGAFLAVTVGIYHPYNTRVSWIRDPALWPRQQPRIFAKSFPDLERWELPATTVLGVDDAGAPVTRAAALTVLDSLPVLRDHLALARAYYAEPSISMRLHLVGMDFSEELLPGALVTRVRLPFGDTAAWFKVNNVITRRGRIHREGESYGVYYSTERIIPDLEARR